ncbi:MAG: hypothetical protein K2V38_17200 [Gemmataceae bacterium]|nr:hypothetical protein [Gemmataceae bacterium]
MSTAPCPPGNAVDCDPELRLATPTVFDLRNRKKARNFIAAEITATGYFKFFVENLPKTTPRTGCPGWWLFQAAWDHFLSMGVTVLGVRGEWTFGDNLDMVNRLTANSAMSLEDAARLTWTGLRAQEKGFSTVSIIDQDGSPGNYLSIDVVFLP